MLKKLFVVFSLIFLLTPEFTFAAALNSAERIKISSAILNTDRELTILLPENYHSNSEATYPVIYLLDGDYNLQGVAGMLDFLANKAQLIPDVILVAIADKGTVQYRQYMTPNGSKSPRAQDDQGKADQFLKFLSKELKPYVNKNYRTANNSILVGHSIGGLFVINALLESPDAFEHFVSISPSVWLNDHAILDKAKRFIETDNNKATVLHLSLGDETRMGVYGLLQLLDEGQPKNIRWQFSHYPNENHNSVGLVALRANLKSIFSGWFITDSELANDFSAQQLLKHYQNLSSSLGIAQPIPTASIKSAIRYFYRQKKETELGEFMAKVKKELPASEQAFIMMLASYIGHYESPQAGLKILLKSETRFQHSVEFLKSIAATYQQLGDPLLAFNYYQKAMNLAKQHKSNQWQINIIEAKLHQNRN